MTLRPMKKAAVLKAWCAFIVDMERHNGWGAAAKAKPLEERALIPLRLLRASLRLDGWRLDVERAEKWTGEVANMVRKELGQ